MKKSLWLWQTAGFVLVSVAGTLLHFVYDWTNQSIIASLVSAINESIWEHTKLLFVPMFIFSLIENKYIGKRYENFWCVKLIGIAFGILIIPMLYYTYTCGLGVNADWLNILTFYIAAALSFWFETVLFKSYCIKCRCEKLAFFALCGIAVIYIIFTFKPPSLPIFADPQSL